MSDQLFENVQSDMDLFKKILSKVPGFGGYVERQNRRDADKLLRETLANRFEEQWQRLSQLQREFISEGEITLIDDLEASAIKLRTFADRIRRAARGYSGLFDAIKINEEELLKLYQYDVAMLDLVDEVSRAVDHIAESAGTDGLKAAIRNLQSVTEQCLITFDRRKEVISGLAQEK